MCDSFSDVDDPFPCHRVLVPVASAAMATNALSLAARLGQSTGAPLRLVHVRIWDPVPRGAGEYHRFFPESSEEATSVVEAAANYAWARGAEASGVVVESVRGHVAGAILDEATEWGADMIVLTLRRHRFYSPGVWEKAARQIMRTSSCPVLLVYSSRS